MSQPLYAEPATMASLASGMATAGTALDAVSANSPGAPDAGDMTAHMTLVLGHYLAVCGQLVIGVSGAADLVAAGGRGYDATDRVAADGIQPGGGAGSGGSSW